MNAKLKPFVLVLAGALWAVPAVLSAQANRPIHPPGEIEGGEEPKIQCNAMRLTACVDNCRRPFAVDPEDLEDESINDMQACFDACHKKFCRVVKPRPPHVPGPTE